MPKYTTLQRSHQFFTLRPKVATSVTKGDADTCSNLGVRSFGTTVPEKRLEETTHSRVLLVSITVSSNCPKQYRISERKTVTSELSGDRDSDEFELRALSFLKRNRKNHHNEKDTATSSTYFTDGE